MAVGYLLLYLGGVTALLTFIRLFCNAYKVGPERNGVIDISPELEYHIRKQMDEQD